MNYRHAFHAGNFADVLKHVVLTRIVEYLKRKEGAFRVIDTHAGIGLYDLAAEASEKTGEWRRGIARLIEAELPDPAAQLLRPYLEVVRALNDGPLRFYPGSPLLVRRLLRRQDRLTAIELHEKDVSLLKANFAGDIQTRVIRLDGWLALGAHLPPKEKRGMALIDPPFEKENEFDMIVSSLKKAHRRWPGGTYAIWYPVKNPSAVARFRSELAASGIPGILDAELLIGSPGDPPRLYGCGMTVVNPPYLLEGELSALLPALCDILAEDRAAAARAEWLTPAP
jgi:23S rRNA (adenine2030-N6)-methyltransferase